MASRCFWLDAFLNKLSYCRLIQLNDVIYLKWERYTRCDGKPDPSSLPQINTFITITKESSNHDINVVLEESKTILGVSTSFQFQTVRLIYNSSIPLSNFSLFFKYFSLSKWGAKHQKFF